MTELEQRYFQTVPNLLRGIDKSMGNIDQSLGRIDQSLGRIDQRLLALIQKRKVYVVTYVGLSDSEYEANGYSDCHVYNDRDAALAKLKELRDAEIETLKDEGRDYEVLKDEDDECRISWCGHGEQVRIEVHLADMD